MPQQERTPVNGDSFLPLEYGQMELPKFSHEEDLVRTVPITLEGLLRDQNFSADLETLKGFKGSQALRQIDRIVDAFVVRALNDQKVEPSLRGRAKSAVERKEWAGVQQDSAEHFALRELLAKTNRLKFALVAKWIETSPDTGLTEVAKAEYILLGSGMAALDRLYLKVVTEPSAIDSNERTKRGLTKNESSVMRMVDGKVSEVPMHKAYPEETAAIVSGYRHLLTELSRLEEAERKGGAADPDSLVSRKIRYYQAVLKAFETSSTEDWLAADTLLPQQIVDAGDVIHIHSIEVGYIKDRHVRAPEMSLRAPDSEAQRTQQFSTETKARMLQNIDDPSFADISTMQSSKTLVEKSNATARHFLGAGMDMDLKPAGQILPNELSTRVNGGVDASLDLSTVHERQPLMNATFIKVFGQKAFSKEYEPRIDAQSYLGDSVASHELAHAIGLHPTTESRLGNDLVGPYVEEWKATAGGLVFNTWIPFTKGEVPIENLRISIMDQLASAARYSANRDQDTAVAYYRQSIMLMKIAEESGVVEAFGDKENPWKISLDEFRVRKFFEMLTSQYHELLKLYAEGKRKDLKGFLGKHLQPTAFVDYMAHAAEDSSSGKSMPTPAEKANLPD